MRSNNRHRVLKEYQRDPYQTVGEIAKRLGISFSLAAVYLGELEKDGLIKRKKLVRHYAQGERCHAGKAGNHKKSKKEREQMLIDRVVAKAEKRGDTFSAVGKWNNGSIASASLSGCKVG